MAHRFGLKRADVALAALLLGTLSIPSTFALAQGGPPPDQDQGQGRPPFGGPGGPGGPFGGQRGVSAAQVPVAALAAGLKLTADQKSAIAKIQKDVQQQRRSLMQPPADDGAGGPPDREQMQANMEKMRSLDQQSKASIEALLTDSQKQALPGFLKEIEAFRNAGIPAEVYGDLKLTADQRQKIVAISKAAQADMRTQMDAARQSGDFEAVRSAMDENRKATQQKTMTILTADQRATVTKYQQAHPRQDRGFGGPGGPGGPGDQGGPPQGGPGQGDQGGPPPPPNGDGGE